MEVDRVGRRGPFRADFQRQRAAPTVRAAVARVQP